MGGGIFAFRWEYPVGAGLPVLSYIELNLMELDFQNLVDLHYAPLYRFALSLARNESDAADLTQQTFCLWAEKGQRQLREAGGAKSWLFTTLYREFLGGRRRVTRHPQVPLDAVPETARIEEAPDTAGDLDAQEVLAALDEVDEVYRATLVLFYLKDVSYKEIAGILGVPIGTVMSRLSRGKAQLREILGRRESAATRARATHESGNLLKFEGASEAGTGFPEPPPQGKEASGL